MKARYYRKLKEKVEKFHEYTVHQSFYPFGDFAGRYGFEPEHFVVKAEDPLMAVHRYARKYRRMHKRWPHGYYPGRNIRQHLRNLSYWAVQDEKGYIDFFG